MKRLQQVLVGVVLAAAAGAQTQEYPQGQQGQGQQPTPYPPTSGQPPSGFPPRDPDALRRSTEGIQGLRDVYPQMGGTQRQGMPGFGAYPGGTAPTTPTGAGGMQDTLNALRGRTLLPYVKKPDEEWPSWVLLPSGQKNLSRSASRAILTRHAERVWMLDPGETAFVPLTFWDKFRVITKGTQLEVRHMGGDFTISMHDGAVLRSHGITKLALTRLDEEAVDLTLTDLRELWWSDRGAGATPTGRTLRVTLPDGAQVEARASELRFGSDGETGSVTNFGPGAARLRTPLGVVEFQHGERVRFLTTPKEGAPLGATLLVEGLVEVERTGRILQAHGRGDGGSLIWSGARISLPAGSSLRLDSLAGREFPEHKRAAQPVPKAK